MQLDLFSNFAPPRDLWMVIPCSGAKLDRASKARDLYVGSMFKSSLKAAEAQVAWGGGAVLILSALHGLVRLDDVLEPYEQRIDQPGAVSAEKVAAQALALGIDWDSDVFALLPKAYFAKLDDALRSFDCHPHFCYEASDRGIGEQRRVNRLAAA